MLTLSAMVGIGLVTVAVVDLVWTALAAGSGPGPVTGRMAPCLWRLALAAHRRTGSHGLLSVAGVLIVVAILVMWIALAFGGWLLVFSSSEGAVRVSETGSPADLVDRVYFTGYSVFTLGLGDLVPGRGLWQVGTVLATATGLVLVTLAITYLVPVASAVAQRRQLASYIASLGASPHDIVIRGWSGGGFPMLSQHFVSLTAIIHSVRQQHLAYPVLHYFHSVQIGDAAPPNLVSLSHAAHLLEHGVASEVTADPAAVRPLDDAIGAFLETAGRGEGSSAVPLEVPGLGPLRAAGVPVVDESAYAATTPRTHHRRSQLAQLMEDDGWTG